MSSPSKNQNNHDLYELQIMEAVEEEPTLSNRKAASKLGVSIKLAHEILGRMVQKGIFHVQKHHSRRWDYFLTPKGISEKARLTMEFLDFSMHFYREARRLSAQVCRDLAEADQKNVAFLGDGDLAEIVYLGVQEWELKLNVIYSDSGQKKFMNIPVLPRELMIDDGNDAIIICEYDKTRPTKSQYLPEGIGQQEKMKWIWTED